MNKIHKQLWFLNEKGKYRKSHLKVFCPGFELDNTVPCDVTYWTCFHLRAQTGNMIHPGQSFGGKFSNEIDKRNIVCFCALMWYKIGIWLLCWVSQTLSLSLLILSIMWMLATCGAREPNSPLKVLSQQYFRFWKVNSRLSKGFKFVLMVGGHITDRLSGSEH